MWNAFKADMTAALTAKFTTVMIASISQSAMDMVGQSHRRD